LVFVIWNFQSGLRFILYPLSFILFSWKLNVDF